MKRFLALVLGLLVAADFVRAELIPAARLYDWQAGVTVGVEGGIPTRTDVVIITAPTDGSDAEPAITSALNALTAGQVGYLPSGTYRLNTGISVPQGTSLRGAGPTTVLAFYNANQGAVYMTAAGDESPYITDAVWSTASNISGTTTKGTDTITIPDASGFTVGDIVLITENVDRTLPVLDVTLSQNRLRQQKSTVTAKTGTTLTIDPPLFWTLTDGPQVKLMNYRYDGAGLEHLAIDMTNAPSVGYAVWMVQAVGCWADHVTVTDYNNYGFMLDGTFRCEVRHSSAIDRTSLSSNGGGIVVQRGTGNLIEDNIIDHGFPHIEVNFWSCGNVFAYNFCIDSDVGDLIGVSIDTNHGPHNHYNLYEGNVSPKLQSDGYTGGASEDTVFRNWLNGWSDTNTQFGYCLFLNRFTRNYNIVGNILGKPGVALTYYKAPLSGIGYTDRIAMVLGWPFIGSGSYTDDPVQMSEGVWWEQWQGQLTITPVLDAYNSSTTYFYSPTVLSVAQTGSSGATTAWMTKNAAKNNTATWITPTDPPNADWAKGGPNGWGAIDLDVSQDIDDGTNPFGGTTLLKGNYNFNTNSVPANESLGGDTIPDSLYRSSKPAWFGNLTWPAFSTSGTPAPTGVEIPAGYRYINGNENYLGVGVATVIGTTTVTGTLTLP